MSWILCFFKSKDFCCCNFNFCLFYHRSILFSQIVLKNFPTVAEKFYYRKIKNFYRRRYFCLGKKHWSVALWSLHFCRKLYEEILMPTREDFRNFSDTCEICPWIFLKILPQKKNRFSWKVLYKTRKTYLNTWLMSRSDFSHVFLFHVKKNTAHSHPATHTPTHPPTYT